MTNTVLILSPGDDAHAIAVASRLSHEFGATVLRWDTDRFPSADTATLHLSGPEPTFDIETDGNVIIGRELRSIWWRRPSRFVITDQVKDESTRAFCWRECEVFFKGALAALGVPIINSPTAELAARKPVQLAVAQKLGLEIPRTLMTNDPDQVRQFWEAMRGNCVYKAFTAPSWQMAETRLLDAESLNELATLRHAPIVVQERIQKRGDIRVSIFDDEVFAGVVSINSPSAELDWRLDITAKWAAHSIPRELSDRLRQLLNALGLRYGSIDLIWTADGHYVFLEVNPSGQFLFLEIETGQSLSRACARMLLSS